MHSKISGQHANTRMERCAVLSMMVLLLFGAKFVLTVALFQIQDRQNAIKVISSLVASLTELHNTSNILYEGCIILFFVWL